MKRERKGKLRLGLLIIIIGLVFMLYPLTSILFNNLAGQRRMAEFQKREGEISADVLGDIISKAMNYNEELDESTSGVVDPFDVENYSTVNPLDYGDGDVFGYISIPKIDEDLPIYLGASEYHLSIGVAQVDGTNLPIGGKDTRAVIAGHRGYTTHRIFKNLNKMEPGDIITLSVLGEVLEYEMYDSEIIKPSEYEKLAVVPGEDTLTLLTCTPFLVGTERLLINAVRINAPVEKGEDIDFQPVSKPQGLKAPQEPSRSVVMEKYALMGIVAILWISLFLVVVKFIRSFRSFR